MNKFLNISVAIVSLGLATQVSATNIAYTVSGNGSGFVGTQSFSGAVSLTTVADIATQGQCMSGGTPVAGCRYVLNSSTDLYIASLGHFSLTNPSISFVNNAASIFGFSEIYPPFNGVNTFAFVDILTGSRLFAAWDGISNFGPIATDLLLNNGLRPFAETSGGALVFNQQYEFSAATFSATLLGAAVPEPASWAMMLLGFTLIGGTLRRKALVQTTTRLTA